MTDFAYVARDGAGQRVTGTIAAGSQREAAAALAARALFPLKVESAASPTRRLRRVRPQAIATMYGQLAGLLRSGVPLLRSLDILRRQSSDPALAELLAGVHADVEQGAALADAL